MTCSIYKPGQTLTFDTVEGERKRLMLSLKDKSNAALELDLGDVHQCDSAGLALLIEVKRLSHQYGKSLQISNINSDIVALAQFCGVNDYLFQPQKTD